MDSLAAPQSDADVPSWIRALDLPGIIDLHVHFMPDRVQQKVWGFFDRAAEFGTPPWPIEYRLPEQQRIQALRDIGVTAFSTLNYAHRPGMAAWLNDYSTQLANQHSDVVHSATFYPEPDVEQTVQTALEVGAKIFKVHIQVGGFSALDPQLEPAWQRVARARTPVVIHCGNGPHRGEHTGIEPIRELISRHPSLVLVIAHAGLPDYLEFAELAAEHSHVYLDTTMIGTSFMEQVAPLPDGFTEKMAQLRGKVILGTDFPTIPHPYSHQLEVLQDWGLGRHWLADALWHTPQKLLDGAASTAAGQPTS